jgi:branched-subunit amino acid aminotransferase/4-amino-4-deoxychorismate lyase
VRNGRARFEVRHARRLARDAAALGLGELDPERVIQALRELAKAAFGDAAGVARVQASRGDDDEIHLLGTPRPIGDDPNEWNAIRAPEVHDGGDPGGPKRVGRPVLARAADAARDAGVDEALLFDGAGYLVEGARTNIVVATESGAWLTPSLARGAVAGIAREITLERIAGLRQDELHADALLRTREIIALNAVHGARPIVRLDGLSVGDDTRPCLEALVAALRSE